MALRNAFDGLATEGTLRRLLDHLRFAKDIQDRMRVVVDTMPAQTGTVTSNVYANATNAVITGVTPFAGAAWNANDARHEMQEMTLQSFQITRNRWSIT